VLFCFPCATKKSWLEESSTIPNGYYALLGAAEQQWLEENQKIFRGYFVLLCVAK